MTLAERGLNMAARMLSDANGDDVDYSRAGETVTLSATFGRSEFQVETGSGVMIEYSDRDFIITAADLILGGVQSIPVRGDKITVGTEEFEVLAPGGAQVYRPCDSTGIMVRVHTKKMT